MQSPMIATADYIAAEEKGRYSELQVLQSGAGWYIGTLYYEPGSKFGEPGSRDSGYFPTQEAAEQALASLTTKSAAGEDVTSLVRMNP